MSTLSSSTSCSSGPQSPSAIGQSVGPIFVNPYATVAVNWLFGSISDVVLDLAMDSTDQAGDSSIDDYCHRMKTVADTLHDVGQPVSKPTLVLNLLRGLTKPYSTTADNIATNSDLTFAAARNQLLLKELRLKNEEKVTAASALVANSAPSCDHSGCRSSSSQGAGQ
ncbi:uncharacterized protein LOC105914238 [Setaria italica]|uniref:uncharacterized protein LOC105914238 n=1 Tax=Setaria italica TaxID=4555 RepID=UPI0006466DA2|nr:uncharacterized protein LOC105914238 [Setaria italica]